MTVTGGLRRAALTAALICVAGCSSHGGAGDRSSAAAPPSASPAPPEALAPAPKLRAGDDARTLLRPDGDLDRLQTKVGRDLHDLQSMHVEEDFDYNTGTHVHYSYDVDYEGRCSGHFERSDVSGVEFRFVATFDGRAFVTTDQGPLGRNLAGRWIPDPPLPPADYCPGGPFGVMLSSETEEGPDWLLVDAHRMGVDQVAGHKAVHFRQAGRAVVIDSWIAADGPTTRVLRLVRHSDNGTVATLTFSEFDSADRVASPPPANRVLPPTQTGA